ncbi:MAG: hypothetical protein HFH49_12710 [Lachnospiraceae bacterium]|nr:hypothetical protein [Lachnospiraceae bacterium]
MIKKLYLNTIQELHPEDEANKMIKKEIQNLLREEEKNLSRREYEMIRDKLFRAASVGEELEFERGFKYAFQLWAECMREP